MTVFEFLEELWEALVELWDSVPALLLQNLWVRNVAEWLRH